MSKNKNKLSCLSCGKEYLSRGWLEKHQTECFKPVINFEDELFIDEEPLQVVDDSSTPSWLNDLISFTKQQNNSKFNLIFLHLNINSLLTKTHHIRDIIDSIKPDLFALNETKLVNIDTDRAVSYVGYTLYRRDRCTNKRGGGVIIYVKNGYF